MGSTVLLLHTEASGRTHVDWLLTPSGDGPHDPDERVLIHFRLATDRPDQTREGESLNAQRGEPHRWLYLDFEGELAGGRGSVRQMARGQCEVTADEGDRITIEVDWGSGVCRWRGSLIEGDRWRLERES